jgi:hypothetical protein
MLIEHPDRCTNVRGLLLVVTGAVTASSHSFRLSESIPHDRLGIVTKNRRLVILQESRATQANPPARLLRIPADHRPSLPEWSCPMTRLRTMLVALAVAALLLVVTASAALAGISASALD